jgi:hypothetical protein
MPSSVTKNADNLSVVPFFYQVTHTEPKGITFGANASHDIKLKNGKG